MADIKKITLGETTYNIDASKLNTRTSTTTAPSATSNDTTIPTSKAVWSAIGNGIRVNDAMVFKGTIGSSGATITALPATHYQGWSYKVITAGTYAGQTCGVGDMIICVTDGTSANNAHWTVVQNNVDTMQGATSSAAGATGLVPAPASGKQASFLRGDGIWATPTNTTYTFNGAVSTIKDSNLTASRALISSSDGKVAVSAVTSTELGYLDGVTSNVQTQLNAKLQTIVTAAGSNINSVGTPSVTASASGTTTTLTFNYLKGAKGDKGDKGDTGSQGPKGDKGATGATGPQGNTGDIGYYIKATVDRQAFTEANWSTYGTVGHNESWFNTSNSGFRVGDLFIVAGTATDSGKGHIAFYSYTGNGTNTLYGTCIGHHVIAAKGAKGDKGDNATTTSNATQSANGLMSAADKTKLDGIAAGAEVNVQSDWNVTDPSSDAYIKNKPTIPTVNNATLTLNVGGQTVSGNNAFTANDATNTTYNVPSATASAYGVIKVSSVNSTAVTVNSETTTAGRYYPIELNSDGKAIVNVPWSTSTINDAGLAAWPIYIENGEAKRCTGLSAELPISDYTTSIAFGDVIDAAWNPNVSMATSTGTNQLTLSHGSKYAISVNGKSFIFTMPSQYSLPIAASGTRGGIKIGYTESGANIPLKLSGEKGYVTLTGTAIRNAVASTDLSWAASSYTFKDGTSGESLKLDGSLIYSNSSDATKMVVGNTGNMGIAGYLYQYSNTSKRAPWSTTVYNIEKVTALPSSPDANTLYIIV